MAILAALLMGFAPAGYAITTSGTLASNETWSGVVTLTGDVVVPEKVTLTIQPGTTIRSYSNEDETGGGDNQSRIELIVQGCLLANGSVSNPITFTSDPLPNQAPVAGDWYGIRIQSPTNSTSQLKYCRLDYGMNGLTIQSGSVMVEDCTFQSNSISGIWIKSPIQLALKRCSITNCPTGMQIEATGSVDIQDCNITHTQYGIYSSYGCAINIKSSTFSSNGTGVYAVIGESTSLAFSNTVFSSNQVGLSTYGSPMSTRSPVVVDNCRFINNSKTGFLCGSSTYKMMTFILGYSVFQDGRDGAYVTADGTILNCTFTGNSGRALTAHSESLSISNSRFVDNQNGGLLGGFLNTTDGYPGMSPNISVLNSMFSACGPYGINLQGGVINSDMGITCNEITGSAVGIVLAVSTTVTPGITNNSIYGNSVYQIQNNGTTIVRPDYNYWGTSMTAELVAGTRNLTEVFDSRDDSSKGQVIISKWLDHPVNAEPPVIVEQPQDQEASIGGAVLFTVKAEGKGTITYQWYRDAEKIAGAAESELNITKVQLSDDKSIFGVVVSSDYGSVTSRWATLTVLTPPSITGQPVSLTLPPGADAVFHVSATGSSPLSYQWQKDGQNLANAGRVSGASASDLTVTGIQASDAGNYRCVVANSVGSTNSSYASLSLITPPSFIQQPVSQIVQVGGNVLFAATLAGSEPMTYQWFFNGSPIQGETNAIYTIPSASTNQAGIYSLSVSNLAGSINSASAVLGLDEVETCATITLYGPVGTPYRIDWSDTLHPSTWTILTNIVLPESPFVIVDRGSTRMNKRFYRIVQQ